MGDNVFAPPAEKRSTAARNVAELQYMESRILLAP